MRKKIIGIIVCMMLIIATAISVTGKVKVLKSPLLGEVMDQSQELDDTCVTISDFEWQEFIPTMDNLVRVEVRVVKLYDGSPDLKLTIEKPLGTILTSKDVPASAIPSPPCGWVSFDVPDILLIPGENYYIKLTAPMGSEYGWGIAWDNPYPQGDSSNPTGDWCFRTFAEVDTSPPNKPSITGSTSGNAGTEYEYKFKSIDPDGDDVYYCIDWGDDTSEICIGPYASGEEATASHTWSSQGRYSLKAKARDIYNAESDWATLEVTMPRNKIIHNTLFFSLFEWFTLLGRLISLIE